MNLKSLLLIPPILVGFAAIYLLGTQEDETTAVAPLPVAVRVMDMVPQTLVATVVGFGRVEAANSWAAITKVEGVITYLAPELSVGGHITEGQLLVEIDPATYQLNLGKARANLAVAQADIAKLDLQEENTAATLEIERRNLEISQTEYERVERLVASGVSSQSSLDVQANTLQKSETAFQSAKSSLSLFPVQRQMLEAAISARQADVIDAETDITNTKIHSPFSGRVTTVSAELSGFSRTGDNLLEIEGLRSAEIVAQIAPTSLRPLWGVNPDRPNRLMRFKSRKCCEIIT